MHDAVLGAFFLQRRSQVLDLSTSASRALIIIAKLQIRIIAVALCKKPWVSLTASFNSGIIACYATIVTFYIISI